MKQILAIISVLAFSAGVAKAHHSQSSQLNLRMADNQFFTASVGNQQVAPAQVARFANVRPGRQWVTVSQRIPNRHRAGTLERVVFSGFVDIPRSSKVRAVINRQNRLVVRSIELIRPVVRGNYGGHVGPRATRPAANVCQPAQVNYNIPARPVRQQIGMRPVVFNQLLASMSNAWFDKDRLVIARQAIQNHGISAQQVLRIMDEFDFDRNRLQLAKFAFGHTTDQQNYFVVNDGFDFNSSIRELDRYLYS